MRRPIILPLLIPIEIIGLALAGVSIGVRRPIILPLLMPIEILVLAPGWDFYLDEETNNSSSPHPNRNPWALALAAVSIGMRRPIMLLLLLQGACCREPAAGSTLQGACCRELAAGSLLQGACCRELAAGSLLQGACCREPAAGSLREYLSASRLASLASIFDIYHRLGSLRSPRSPIFITVSARFARGRDFNLEKGARAPTRKYCGRIERNAKNQVSGLANHRYSSPFRLASLAAAIKIWKRGRARRPENIADALKIMQKIMLVD